MVLASGNVRGTAVIVKAALFYLATGNVGASIEGWDLRGSLWQTKDTSKDVDPTLRHSPCLSWPFVSSLLLLVSQRLSHCVRVCVLAMMSMFFISMLCQIVFT